MLKSVFFFLFLGTVFFPFRAISPIYLEKFLQMFPTLEPHRLTGLTLLL